MALSICFGVIKEFEPSNGTYLVSTELAEKAEISVSSSVLRYKLHLPDISDSTENLLILQTNDDVKLHYSLENHNDLDSPIIVVAMEPIQLGAIGVITHLGTDSVVLDDIYTLPRDRVVGSRLLNEQQPMEYEAIKCSGSQTPYRCVWGKALSGEIAKRLLVSTQSLKENISARSTMVVRVVEPNALITLNTDEGEETSLVQFTVKNLSTKIPQPLLNIFVIKDSTEREPVFNVISPNLDDDENIEIHGGTDLVVTVEVTCKKTGIYEESLVFEFANHRILRSLKCICGDKNFVERFTTSYKPPSDLQDGKWLKRQLAQSEHRPTKRRQLIKNELKSTSNAPPPPLRKRGPNDWWNIPEEIRKLLLAPCWRNMLLKDFPMIYGPFNPKTYADSMHSCLYVEELEAFRMFQQMNSMHKATKLKPSLDKFLVPFPNLIEMKFTIMCFASLRAKYKDSEGKECVFDGIIVKINADDVVVRMDPEFLPDLTYELYFYFSRTQYVRQHEAIEEICKTRRLASLFPVEVMDNGIAPILDVEMSNSGQLTIAAPGKARVLLNLTKDNLDASQRTVIRNVLRGELRSLPYLIHGPPGTGKTTTLAEIIAQLVTHDAESRILVCTQSNSAATVLLEKCHHLKVLNAEQMVRIWSMNASNFDFSFVKLRKYCATLTDVDQVTECTDSTIRSIDLAMLLSYRVVIMTCGLSGTLRDMGVSQTHFTHLIIDEAGQCLETEAIVSMGLMESHRSQVILAGDSKQLGPVLMCPYLTESNLSMSLFERIGRGELYDHSSPKFNTILSNELNYNYRSVPTVLELFNGLFYEQKLKAMVVHGPQFETLKELQKILPQTGGSEEDDIVKRREDMGVFFYAVYGSHQRSSCSPSIVNPKEAEVVLDLLLKMTILGIDVRDIGIICPYQGQVHYLKGLMKIRKMPYARVGSVEEFQGQEKPIIILTTVRSSEEQFQFEKMKNMGFLANPKRLNVALSRAQSLLIIVGNPVLLEKDEHWKKVITYCTHRNAYVSTENELEKVMAASGGQLANAKRTKKKLKVITPAQEACCAARGERKKMKKKLRKLARKAAQDSGALNMDST